MAQGGAKGGLFTDVDPIRRVAREGVLLAGGGRATLLQVAHPSVARGVAEHSTFAHRPLDRLRGTLTYVYGVVFGTRDEARRISRAVRSMHGKVTGPGYRADDPALQVWVNATLYDTAMLIHDRIMGPLTDREADLCYRQYAVFATELGCPREAWPVDREAFAGYWKDMVDTLTVSDQARDICRALLHPTRPPLALRIGTPANRLVAIGLLPERLRAQYGYAWSARQARRLERVIRTTGWVYPRVPSAVRALPKTYYLRELRKRMPPISHTTRTST
jgi:uncharacterized protein (DUF2236 family)